MLRVVNALTTYGKYMEKAVVLVVEDEAIIRISALQIVEDAGFAIIEASNADEAIRILQNRTDIARFSPTSGCPAQWTDGNWRVR
ncbi:MAG: hypothetical protein WDM89_06120 [Rhizomicrobium sp.]